MLRFPKFSSPNSPIFIMGPVVFFMPVLVMIIMQWHAMNTDAWIPHGLRARVAQLPVDDAATHDYDRDVIVLVHADRSITINQEAVARKRLAVRFLQIYGWRGQTPVFIGADPELDAAVVLDVIDTVHGAGLDQVVLLPLSSYEAFRQWSLAPQRSTVISKR